MGVFENCLAASKQVLSILVIILLSIHWQPVVAEVTHFLHVPSVARMGENNASCSLAT